MASNEIQYELKFSDKTLLESEGVFDTIKEIMKIEPFSYEWMLESNLVMVISMGEKTFEANFILHFYYNGNIYITDYLPSGGDAYSNPDIRGLSIWAGENGWTSIRPHNDLVRSNIDFWKYFWETNLVDSDFLDKNYGLRDVIETKESSDNN